MNLYKIVVKRTELSKSETMNVGGDTNDEAISALKRIYPNIDIISPNPPPLPLPQKILHT